MTTNELNKKKKGSWIKTDYDRVMNKTMDSAWNLSTSIAEDKILIKNEMSILAPIGVSIQILLEELLFSGYSETKAKDLLDRSLKLAFKNHKDFIKECEKKSSKKKNGR